MTGLLLNSQSQSQDLAEYMVARYSAPALHISQLTVTLDDMSDSDLTDILLLDLGALVTVQFVPMNDHTITAQTLVVEGIRHQRTFNTVHTVTFELGSVFAGDFFTLDTSTLDGTDGLGY